MRVDSTHQYGHQPRYNHLRSNAAYSESSIFILNIRDSANSRDIWSFFQRQHAVKDIILPRKRDINGKRFGFIHTYDHHTAISIVKHFNGSSLMNNKLLVKINTKVRKSRASVSSSMPQQMVNFPPPPPLRRTDKDVRSISTPQVVIDQPLHRTLTLEPEEHSQQQLDRSLIRVTAEDQWGDILQEKINLSGYIHAKLLGISHRKFLITFPTEQDKDEISMQFLNQWFKEIKPVSHIDLTPSRIAWVYCDGLPFTAWNLSNWEKIFGDWGYVLTRKFLPLSCGMIQSPRICIQTYQVRDIEETLKVIINGKPCWVKIRESKICFDTKETCIASPDVEITTDSVSASSDSEGNNSTENNTKDNEFEDHNLVSEQEDQDEDHEIVIRDRVNDTVELPLDGIQANNGST